MIRQLTYMVINTRQRLLALSGTMRARFGEAFSREMIDEARELVNQALLELSEMPRRGIDPDWLEEEDLTFTEQSRSYAIATQRTRNR